MPRVTVLYFAAARERAGCAREEVEVGDAVTVAALLERLVELHPGLEPLLPHLRSAVNQEFVGSTSPLKDGDEVALIPPVSGGSARLFRIVDRPLSLDEVVEAVEGEGCGGLVTFTGSVRSATRGRAVLKLEYEAYAPMAEKKLAEIAGEASARWPGVRIAIVHRIGTLLPGEKAVVIAVASPHRGEAFAACQFTIDRLKQDVPIWKKEHYADGEVWVGLGP